MPRTMSMGQLRDIRRKPASQTGANTKAVLRELDAECEVSAILASALAPFRAFLDAFERQPIRGLDTEQIYAIHGGKYVEGGSYLGWEHLKAAREAIVKYEVTR